MASEGRILRAITTGSTAFAAGTLLSFQVTYLPVPLLSALALLALVLGRRTGMGLAFLSLGLLVAAVRLDLPESPAGKFDRDRPLEALVKVTGHWTLDDEGWSAPARILRLRQGDRVSVPPLDVILHLPGSDEPHPFGGKPPPTPGERERAARWPPLPDGRTGKGQKPSFSFPLS